MDELLKTSAEAMGCPLTDEQRSALIRYYDILIERNKFVNLTRITEPEDVAAKHFLDSLTPLLTGHVGGKIIDVGTGAGFPGLVLKCVKPDAELTLLDSLNKRVSFLRDAAEAMGLDGIEFVHARAEDAGHDEKYRERFDTVVSRAVANMRTLSEWCIPFLRVGGYFLAMKGPSAQSELDGAREIIETLGGRVEDIYQAEIPGTELEHKIIIVKKLRPTPTRFAVKGRKSTASPAEKGRKRK